MSPMLFPYLMYRCWLQMFFPRPTLKFKDEPVRYEG